MRQNSFSRYMLLELLVIACVTLLFKFVVDRQVAATIAGFLFVGLPVAMMVMEYRRSGWRFYYWFIAVLQFWLLFAVPILGLRLLNWGVAFDQLAILGVPGPLLHQWSSKSYMIMVLGTLLAAVKARKK